PDDNGQQHRQWRAHGRRLARQVAALGLYRRLDLTRPSRCRRGWTKSAVLSRFQQRISYAMTMTQGG
ncbi:MAG TPA: hypothetical protein VF742_03085, partial [Terracidiphilus sp.]